MEKRMLARSPQSSCNSNIGYKHSNDIFSACENGRANIVQMLLTVEGHSITYSQTGDTILHGAVASQDSQTVGLVLQNFPQLMVIAL